MRAFIFAISLVCLLASCAKPGDSASSAEQMGDNCALMPDATSPAKKVCFENRGGYALIEGDILLGTVEELKAQTEILKKGGPRGAVALTAGNLSRWPNRTVPYVIDASVPNQFRITDAMAHHQANTGTRFVLRTTQADYVRFSNSQAGCFSSIGRRGGQQIINIEIGCSTGNTIHEIAHAVGLFHEQSREDRDQFVNILTGNINPAALLNFERQLVFAQDFGAYDFGSIMHYGAFDFSINGQPTITKKDGSTFGVQRNGLSAGDISGIEQIYGASFVEAPSYRSTEDGGAPNRAPAVALSANSIQVFLVDNSDSETSTVLEMATSASGSFSVAATRAGDAALNLWYPSIGSLLPDTLYFFRARALRGSASSAYSAQVSVRTPNSVPNAPSALASQVISSSQINLGWADNSSNETGFQVERRLGSSGSYALVATTGANATSFASTGLAPSSTYYFRVRAVNSVGVSAYTSEVFATTPAAAPAAPGSLAGLAASQTQINLSWADNSSNETGFKLERKTGSSGTYAQVVQTGAGVTSYQNAGLAAGTTYFFRVRATNAAGDSAYSNEVSVATLVTPPSAPSNLVASAVSASQINLSWTDNSGNETAFLIERKIGSGGTYSQIAQAGAGATSYSNNAGLSPGTNYVYRVRASNSGGSSAYSNEASATTPIPPPIAPSNLVASATSASQVSLSWADNSNNETGFNIYRKTGSGGTYARISQVGAGVTSYANAGLVSATTYFYRVRAVNSAGSSAYSNEASATTSVIRPASPTNLTFSRSAGQVVLSWQDNSTNETRFDVDRKIGSGSGTWVRYGNTAVNTTSLTDTGVAPNLTYQYRVRAYNSAGGSSYSNVVTATGVHVAFVSSVSYSANMGGLAGADAKCQTLASNAGRPGTWKAVLSDSNTDAKTRLNLVYAVQTTTGLTVASSPNALWSGSIQNYIGYTETGARTNFDVVWSGTQTSGLRHAQPSICGNWTMTAANSGVEIGRAFATDFRWIAAYTGGQAGNACSASLRLYCMSVDR